MRTPRLALLAAVLATALGAQERVGFPVSDWVYRLQPREGQSCAEFWAEIDATDTQVAVLDPSCGDDDTPMTAAQLLPLCTRPDGSPRMVIAYLSVGEAEDYRFYWQPGYTPEVVSDDGNTPGNPSWLGPRNPDWPDNYLVRYWEPGWHKILIDGPPLGPGGATVPSALDRITSAGFDGVYLDLVDNYKHWEEDHPLAKHEMAGLVRAIRDGGRARFTKPHGPGTAHPGFVVVVQNGLELFFDPAVKASIRGSVSAIAVEALSFDAHDLPADPDTQLAMEAQLVALTQDDYVVFTADYALAEANRVAAATRSRARGFLPWVGQVDLDQVYAQPQVGASSDILYVDLGGSETTPEGVDLDEVEYGTEDRPSEDPDAFDDDVEPGADVGDPGGLDDLDEDGQEDVVSRGWSWRRRRAPPPECEGDKPGILPVIAAATVGGVIGLAAAPVAGVVGLVAGGAAGELWRMVVANKDCDQRDRLARYIEGPPRLRRQDHRRFTGDPGTAADLRDAFRAVQEAVEAGDEDAQQEAWERLRALQRTLAEQRDR